MSNPRDEIVETRTIDGAEVNIFGLYTTGEVSEVPGDDGYDVWLYPDGEEPILLNDGEALDEIPTDDAIRELIAEQ